MVYYFNHFMQLWILPPGINLILGFLGIFALRYRPVLGKFLVFFALMSLWVLSMPMVAQKLIDNLQQQYPAISNLNMNSDESAAIVVLEAGLNLMTPEYGSPIVSPQTLQRLHYAAFLHQKTGIPILVSGSYPITPDINHADYMAKSLKEYFGIDTKWKEDRGATTADEGTYATNILKKDHVKKIYLVTEAMHMPRAMYVFQNRGIKIIPAPTAYRMVSLHLGKVSNFLPTTDALEVSSVALHEYIGMLWYRLYWRY